MLIQWKDHRGWAYISAGILLVATVTYVIYASSSPNGAHGGSVAGLIYGIIGTLMMVFAGLLAGRKRVPHWRLGSAKFWLKGHLWLGTLSFPLILFHAGFGWGGLLENILWITFGIVVVSGFVGVALQHFLPRLLTSRVPYETFTAQLPYQCRRMQFLADQAVAKLCGKLDVREDDFYPEFEKLAKFGAEASKDELPNWPDQVDQNWRGLFVDLGKTSKQNGWINKEDNFPKMMAEIYEGLDFKPPAKAKPAGKKGPSPLEQMKAKKAAAGGGADASPKKKVSPLEAARQQAAKKSGDTDKPAKKKSPLELAREQAAAKAGGDAPAKKKSPLELAREQAQKKAEGGDAPAKKKSPLELAREQAKKKTEGEEAPAKKKSPLELAREQAQKKAEGGDAPTKKKSPLELAREQIKKKTEADEAPAKKKSPLELAREQAAAKNRDNDSTPAPRMSTADPGQMATLNFTAEEMGNLARLAAQGESFDAEEEEAADESLHVPCRNPECDYQLLIPNRSLLGRKARCPMCQKKFILKEPVEKEPEEEEVLMTAGVVGVFESNQTTEIARIEEERRSAASKRRESLSWDLDESPIPTNDEPEKPAPTKSKKRLSPLEIVRQQAAKATGENAPPPVKKAMSKIEQMRAAVKAKGGAAAKPKPTAKKPAAATANAAAGQSIQIRGFVAPPKQKGPIVRSEHLKKFYLSRLRPFLDFRMRSRRFPEFQTEQSTSRMFNQLRAELPGELHGVLGELEGFATERRQFRTLSRIHKSMHTWLILHIPISMALFVLVIVHIIVALRVVPPF
ncbi:hypothetical protein [Thalassoroseus pseudoceratinae]|uniref:hypothetical protein n=1 Tax=Thalassoroseus pseudoceratinae TaxID=2713176 RepID=UPI0014237CEA|nr:hypothetical protein [Thalassoroseus pseudoceratinae]